MTTNTRLCYILIKLNIDLTCTYKGRNKTEKMTVSTKTINQLDNQKNQTQLFYCSPALLSRPWRGEPNFTHTAHIPTSPNGARVTGHGSLIIKNEPNYITANRNSAIEIRKSLTILYPHNAAFTQKNPKIAKNAHVLQISENNTLNSIYNKVLHKYFTPPNGPRVTGHGSQFMKNEPNLQNTKRGNYEKRTQSRATSHKRR